MWYHLIDDMFVAGQHNLDEMKLVFEGMRVLRPNFVVSSGPIRCVD